MPDSGLVCVYTGICQTVFAQGLPGCVNDCVCPCVRACVCTYVCLCVCMCVCVSMFYKQFVATCLGLMAVRSNMPVSMAVRSNVPVCLCSISSS